MRKLIVFLCSIFLLSCTQSQPNGVLTQDPNLTVGKLDNGLQYFILPNNFPQNRVYLRLVVNAGSMNEDDDQRGVAHIVEHMAFNGSTQFPQNSVINALEKLGMTFARDINAFTDFENTVYTLNLNKNDLASLNLAFNIINQWANHLTILATDLEAERGIVLEEWRARLSPMLRLGDQKSAIELKGSRYALRDPIGEVAVIKNISRKRVNDFYRKWYRPDNMTLLIVGDINPSQIQQLLSKNFPEKNRILSPLEKIDYHIPLVNQWRLAQVADPGIHTPAIEFSVMNDFNPQNTQQDYKQDLISQIIIRLINLRLQQWEKNHPLVKSANFYQDNIGKQTQQKLFSLQLNEPQYWQSLNHLFEFIAEIKQNGFSEQEINTEINHLKQLNEKHLSIQLGSLKIADDLVSIVANNQIYLSQQQKYYLNKKLLNDIKETEINDYFNQIINLPSKLVMITQPNKISKLTFSATNIEQLWQQKLNQSQLPWQSLQKNKIEIPKLNLTSGNIIKQQYFKPENIYRYQLTNGSQLIYLQTNKTPNQVYFKAVTSGGLRSIPSQQYHQLRTATTLVDETGVGNLSVEEFSQIFSQKSLVLASIIDDYQQGFSGAGKAEYLEDILQLFHLKLQSAHISQEVFEQYKKESLAYLSQLDVSEKFTRYISTLRYKNQPTAYSLDRDMLHNFNRQKLMDIYQQYFLGKTDFTYFIVGDISKNKVEQLAKKYLASIPVITQNNKINALKATIPNQTAIQTGLTEPRAEIEFSFTADQAWNIETNYLLDILSNLIQEQLRLDLREKYSGIYAVNSWFNQDKYANQIEARISFSCSPNRVEELSQLAQVIFDNMAKNGVDAELLQKKIKEKQNELKQESENSLAILNLLQLSFNEKNNPDLIYIASYLPHLATKENIDQLAHKLLAKQQRFLTILKNK